jgi:hypothetical protein
MTLSEIQKSPLADVAKWFVKLGACPMETGEEPGCIVDEDGDHDCKTCWEMHLEGVERCSDYDDPDDAKRYGRGYCV